MAHLVHTKVVLKPKGMIIWDAKIQSFQFPWKIWIPLFLSSLMQMQSFFFCEVQYDIYIEYKNWYEVIHKQGQYRL